jgi:AcrR family transcriptional regulator
MTEVASYRRPQGRSAARREEILEAAFEVFSTKGFDGGSLRAVAERVGLSEAGVLHHFASKAELLMAVLDHRDAVQERVVGPAPTAGVARLEWVLAVAWVNTSTPGVIELFLRMAVEATSPDHPAHEWFVRRVGRTRRTLTESFEALRSQGLLAPGVDVEEAATSTIAIWNGLQLQELQVPGSVETPAGLAAHLRRLVTAPLRPMHEGLGS